MPCKISKNNSKILVLVSCWLHVNIASVVKMHIVTPSFSSVVMYANLVVVFCDANNIKDTVKLTLFMITAHGSACVAPAGTSLH